MSRDKMSWSKNSGSLKICYRANRHDFLTKMKTVRKRTNTVSKTASDNLEKTQHDQSYYNQFIKIK